MLQPKKDSLSIERKEQLDSNIKNMLSNGASQEDVTKYAADFKSQFGIQKKKDFSTEQNQDGLSPLENSESNTQIPEVFNQSELRQQYNNSIELNDQEKNEAIDLSQNQNPQERKPVDFFLNEIRERKKEEFLENLDKTQLTQLQQENLKKIDSLGSVNKQLNFEIDLLNNESLELKDEIEKLSDGVQKASENGTLTQEGAKNIKDRFDQITSRANEIESDYKSKIKNFNSNEQDLQGFGEELELFKKNWNIWDNSVQTMKLIGARALNGLAQTEFFIQDLTGVNAAKDDNVFKTGKFLNQVEKEEALLKPKKSVTELNSAEDVGEYVVEAVSEQIPILLQISAGPAGITSIGGSSFGNKIQEIDKVNEERKKEGKVEISDNAAIATSLAVAGTETIGAFIDRLGLNLAGRTIKSIGKAPIQNAAKKLGKQLGLEVSDEVLLGTWTNNALDKYVLGKDIGITDGTLDAIAKTTITLGLLNGSPVLAGEAINSYVRKKDKKVLAENILQIKKIQESIENTNEDSTKKLLSEKTKSLINQNKEILSNSLQKINSLSEVQLKEIESIELKQAEQIKAIEDISNSNDLSENTKKDLISDFQKDISDNEISKNKILDSEIALETEQKNEDTSFDAIDSIIKEESSSTIDVETNLNTYQVENVEGELKITPKLGIKEPSNSEIKKITEQYIEKTDFESGKRADFSNKGENLSQENITDIILEESENAVEIAQQIETLESQITDENNSIRQSKTGAISKALQGVQVSKESFSQVDDVNNVQDVNPFYFNSRNKIKKGNDGLIDNIRESAQQFTDETVELSDITDFIKENKNPKSIELEENSTAELKEKFTKITGLKPTKQNIEKVSGKEQTQERQNQENIKDDQVPFQTESNQERISGKELRSLVDRLIKTGLSKDVKILSNNNINNFLSKVDNNSKIRNSFEPDEVRAKRHKVIRQKHKARALKKQLNKIGLKLEKMSVAISDWGVSTYLKYKDKNGITRKFRISDHSVTSSKRIRKEYHYNVSSSIQEIVSQVKRDIETNLSKRESNEIEIRQKAADEKWNRIKFAFEGLAFNRVENIVTNPSKFKNVVKFSRRGARHRSNVLVEELGNNRYSYEWSEPISNFGISPQFKPSVDYIESIDESKLDSDIKFQKEFNENQINKSPNGFVYENIVYLNSDKVKKDTPIHEFGHLWNSYIKKNNTEAYNTGLNLVKDSEYHNAVKSNEAYSNLTEEQKLEEALAQAIGEKGVKILNESKKAKFNTWFKNLFTKIARGLGIRSLTGEQLSNLTLEKFTDLASAELLSGQEIVPLKNNASKTKIDSTEVSNIEIVITEQKAIKKTRDNLRQKFNESKFFIADVKKELVAYIKENIDSKRVNELQKRELTKLLGAVQKSKTKNNLLKSFNQVNDIVTELDNRIIKKRIDSILSKKFSKKESGRRKANITNEEAENTLNFIKKNISTPKISESNIKERRGEQISALIDSKEQLLQKDNLTQEEDLELQAIGISLDVLNGITSSDVNNTNQYFLSALEQIEEIFEEGRSRLKELKETRKLEDEKALNDLEEDANPQKITSNKSLDEIKNEVKKSGNSISRIVQRATHNWFSGKLSGSLDSIATIISKKGGTNRDSSSWVQFVNNLKSKETLKKARVRKYANKWKSTQKEIFGSIKKADIALNKIVEIERQVIPENSTDKVLEKTNFTVSQLLNVWQNYKNEGLRSGLDANGFSSEVFDQINTILPQKVKDYGDSLISLYDEMYIDANEVYTNLNFHSLGKPDFYAGKVYREGNKIQEDTNALLGGNFSIGTTGYGSQKERVTNNNPINAKDVNLLFSQNLQESSHYVAFAEAHRIYNKVLRNPEIQKAILLNNGVNGDQIINTLTYYKIRDVEQGGERGNKIVDALGRNVARSVLGLKAKIGITQTISIVNGSFDLPTKLKTSEFIKNYNPAEVIKNVRFLMNNSDYMKNRYDIEGLENAVLGLESIVQDSEFTLNNPTLEAKRRAIGRFYKRATNVLLLNVKFGDMVGVLGATPVYSSWKTRYLQQGFSEEAATKKAIKQFESSVDRSQQSISAFGKSEIQKHPYLRYLMMFATAPIQNFQNANFHRRELVKSLRGKEFKGTNTRNALAFLNYQFAQPMLYTYISNILVGSAFTAAKGLFDDEEEVKDADKALLSSAVLGNVQSIPFVGGVLLYTIDKIVLDKEFTFANVIGSPLYDEIKKIENHIKLANTSKSDKSKERHIFEATKKTSGILFGIPNFSFDVFNEWDDVYFNDNISTENKTFRALGYSKIVIKNRTGEDFRKDTKTRGRRLTPEEAQKKRDKAIQKRNER